MLQVCLMIGTLLVAVFKIGFIVGHVFSNGKLFPWMRHILGDIRSPEEIYKELKNKE